MFIRDKIHNHYILKVEKVESVRTNCFSLTETHTIIHTPNNVKMYKYRYNSELKLITYKVKGIV